MMRCQLGAFVPLLLFSVFPLEVHGLAIPHATSNVAAAVALESKSPRRLENASVWVFFTTTKKRAHAIPRVVESLMRQTHRPRAITINIGDSGTMRKVASANKNTVWQNSSLLNLHLELVDENGPGTKYPTQEQLDLIPQDDFVLILDDDWEYSPVVIERLLHDMTDKRAHSFRVRTEGSAPGYSAECPKTDIKYPLGYASRGFLFRKSFLDGLESFRKFIIQTEPMCKFVDDMYVSGYLFLRGIGIDQVVLADTDQQSVDIGGGSDGALRVTHQRGCENNACRDAVLKVSEHMLSSSGVKSSKAKPSSKAKRGQQH